MLCIALIEKKLTVGLIYNDFGSDSSAISHRFYLGRKVEFHAIVIVNSGAKKACHYMHNVVEHFWDPDVMQRYKIHQN